MRFKILMRNFVIIAFVISGRTLCFLVDLERWASDTTLPDRKFIPTCFGENLDLPWKFIPALSPVIDIEWHFARSNQSSNESLLATLVSGHFFAEPHAAGRLEYIPDSGIRLLNLQPQDSGNYSVEINVRGSDFYVRSVMVQVTTSPIALSDRLQVSLNSIPIYTDQYYHLVLSCGTVADVWNSRIKVLWQTPSHRILQSSYHSGGRFDLYVPNPVEDGQYTCMVDSSSPAGHCIPSLSLLLSGSTLHVDATKGTIILMQAQIDRQKSEILSQNSQISSLQSQVLSMQSQIQHLVTQSSSEIASLVKTLFSMVLTGGRNSHEGRVEIRFGVGTYGTVCDDSWSTSDAMVVCKMLGYPNGNAQAWSNAHFGQGTGPILLDDVVCQGSESHLLDCTHSAIGTHNCGHGEDAGVTCQ